MTSTVDLFRACWDEQVEDNGKRSPSFSLADYTATGRASAAYNGKRGIDWWLDNGPNMVDAWVNWRKETKWDIWVTPTGLPGIEIEFNIVLAGDIPVKGLIDRVFTLPGGEVVPVDLKTGRLPETAEQLGLYRVGLGMTFGVWPKWGYYWNPDKGHGQPLALEQYTPDYFAKLYEGAIAGMNAGCFLPKPANNCKNWCGVSRHCKAVGGAEADGVDPLTTLDIRSN